MVLKRRIRKKFPFSVSKNYIRTLDRHNQFQKKCPFSYFFDTLFPIHFSVTLKNSKPYFLKGFAFDHAITMTLTPLKNCYPLEDE